METKDLVRKQLKKQFQKGLEERVAREDLIEWCRRKTYVEEVNERLQALKKKPSMNDLYELEDEIRELTYKLRHEPCISSSGIEIPIGVVVFVLLFYGMMSPSLSIGFACFLYGVGFISMVYLVMSIVLHDKIIEKRRKEIERRKALLEEMRKYIDKGEQC